MSSWWTVQTEGSMLTVRTWGDSASAVLIEARRIELNRVMFLELLDYGETMEPARVLLRLDAISSIEPDRRAKKTPTSS